MSMNYRITNRGTVKNNTNTKDYKVQPICIPRYFKIRTSFDKGVHEWAERYSAVVDSSER